MVDSIIPQDTIPIQGQRAVANYDYVDIANGLGYNTFYINPTLGLNGKDFPNNAEPDTDPIATFASGDNNFDTSPLNSPRVVKGNAVVVVRTAGYTGRTIAFRVYLVRGGTETAISASVNGTVAATNYTNVASITLTQTTFKKGDILRLKVTTSGGVVNYYRLTSRTTSRIEIPFRIDL